MSSYIDLLARVQEYIEKYLDIPEGESGYEVERLAAVEEYELVRTGKAADFTGMLCLYGSILDGVYMTTEDEDKAGCGWYKAHNGIYVKCNERMRYV